MRPRSLQLQPLQTILPPLCAVPLRSPQLLSLPAVWDRITTRHRGGRGVSQHNPRRTACCQWEMSAFIATLFCVDPHWANLQKRNKRCFSKGVIPIRIFSKRLMTMGFFVFRAKHSIMWTSPPKVIQSRHKVLSLCWEVGLRKLLPT